MAKNDTKTFTVEQYASQIRRPGKQTQVLTASRLKRIGDRRTLKDTPEARGMVAAVAHLVRVVEA